MAVTIKEVEHVAKLARLEFNDAEKEKLTHELNDILTHIDKLNTLDTSNVEPLSHVNEPGNVMREDIAKPSLPREDALRNAPDKTDEFFKVPKVIGDR